jgi:quinol monooxygenase YgiN
MLMIVGTVRIPADKLAAARQPMATVIEASRAEAGCLEYSYGEDVLDPGLIHVLERWQDWDAFRAHGKAPHADAWRACWPELGLYDRRLDAYEIGEPQPV